MNARKKVFFGALALLFLIAGGIFVFRAEVAWGFVRLGNEFFGGSLPYDLTLADSSYQVALALDERVPDAWHQRARISFLRGDFDSAIDQIEKQISLHGKSFMASYYIRGLIHGYRKEWRQAERDFTTFLLWDKTNWAAHNDLAWVFFSQGKYLEAEERARGGLYIHPNNPWLLTTHAMALFNLDRVDEAYSELLKAKEEASKVGASQWSIAYPGNDPKIAGEGASSFIATIDANIALIEKARATGILQN